MTTPLITIAAILALGTLFVLIPVASDSYRRFRRRRVVTCPETKSFAEIQIDAGYAAVSSAFGEPRAQGGPDDKRRDHAGRCFQSHTPLRP